MNSRSLKIIQWMSRRGESGQSIILLAMGFIALLGFVGIVTDVSLMFVRYSTLRRAVDAASIAAAGQMRQDRNMATVGLAARQYIEFHGLDPKNVLVETCATVPDVDNNGIRNSIDDPELCTADQRKLVRVTAQVTSETVFLRFLGWRDLTLEASALSETAVLDVVIVLDVSESMLDDTSYEDWAQIGLGTVFVPPRWKEDIQNNKFRASNPSLNITTVGLWQGTTDVVGGPEPGLAGFAVSQESVNRRLNYVDAPSLNLPGFVDNTFVVRSYVPGAFSVYGPQGLPRNACTVRFFPNSISVPISDSEKSIYAGYWPAGTATWQGFRPTYNFYGCCNDPTSGATVDLDGNITAGSATINGPYFADFTFEDLICQPFKQARDATRDFLQRIDFVRGDRVGFVLFGRSAFILNPYDSSNRALGFSHMIDNFTDAVSTLNQFVGVRAEPNFYDWDEVGDGLSGWGRWAGYAAGFDQGTGDSNPINYFDPNALQQNNYPVKDNCPYQNASLFYPYTPYTSGNPAYAALTRIMIPNSVDTSSAYYNAGWIPYNLRPVMSYELWGSCRDTNIGAALREGNNALLNPLTSRRAGTVWIMILLSDGAAGASDPVRRNGEKLLTPSPYEETTPGSGIYGLPGEYGSLGVCPYGTPAQPGELVDVANDIAQYGFIVFPFCSDERPETRNTCNFRPEEHRDNVKWTLPRPALKPPYSGFGLLNESTDIRTDNDYVSFPTAGWPAGYAPFDPTSSFDVASNPAFAIYDLNGDGIVQDEQTENLLAGNIYDVDIGSYPNECLYYDVDDYARDWADFVGLLQPNQGDDAQLPTIFSIAFGLSFARNSPTPSIQPGQPGYVPGPASANIEDFLGEELLRYIADVGDNFRMDIDHQQTFLAGGTTPPDGYGARSVCEDPTGAPGAFLPLAPTQNCGNYFSAPDQKELEQVFDEIASRMFTRLAG